MTHSLSHAAVALSLCLPVLGRATTTPTHTPAHALFLVPSPPSQAAKRSAMQGLGQPGLMVSNLTFNASLPLLGVGLVTLILSLCFCCYLWKLRRDARSERGYCQLKYSPRSKKVKNDVCPVCLEEFEQAEKLAVSRCRHGFHTKCLQQWLDQHNTCPMCKAQVAVSQAGERTGLITTSNV